MSAPATVPVLCNPSKANALKERKKDNKVGASSTASEDLLKAEADFMADCQTRKQWKEYNEWCERLAELAERPNSNGLIRNLSIRVKALEAELGIPADMSITNDYLDDCTYL